MKHFLIVFALLGCLSLTTKKSKKFKGPEDYVFIPSGTIEMEGQNYTCNAFWMSAFEVTNREYLAFLKHLKMHGKAEEYQKALPDTSAWKSTNAYSDPMFTQYLRHPAYANFPVVNVSTEGANLYCAYLTNKYKAEYGDVIENFRLPTRKEWMYAAAAGKDNARYAWKEYGLRNEKGDLLANFRRVGDRNITLTENGVEIVEDSLYIYAPFDDAIFITAPSKSYWPNEFGLYNMCGNVAELVAKEDVAVGGSWRSPGYDIRIQSKAKFEKPNPFTGFRPVLTFVKARK